MILKQMLDRNPQNKELLKLLRETMHFEVVVFSLS